MQLSTCWCCRLLLLLLLCAFIILLLQRAGCPCLGTLLLQVAKRCAPWFAGSGDPHLRRVVNGSNAGR